jgi:hypothetical protein
MQRTSNPEAESTRLPRFTFIPGLFYFNGLQQVNVVLSREDLALENLFLRRQAVLGRVEDVLVRMEEASRLGHS